MAKVTFVLGLCGSGKTYLSERLNQQTGAKVFESLLQNYAEMWPELKESLTNGQDCIVEEIWFCAADFRLAFTRELSTIPHIVVEWLCFENDLDSANWNVDHRTNKGEGARHREINGRAHLQYTYPEGATPMPIFRIAATESIS